MPVSAQSPNNSFKLPQLTDQQVAVGLTQALCAMSSGIAAIVFLAALGGSPPAFDHTRYEESSVDALLERAAAFDIHESGQSVLTPPLPVHIRAPIVTYPQECPDDMPTMFLRVVGVKEPPAMKWCMAVQGASGQRVNMWVQDSFAPSIVEEYELGDEIELWALWLFVNATDRKPYFVVNAIGAANETIVEQLDGT